MDFLAPSPSTWHFVGDVDEAVITVIATSTVGPVPSFDTDVASTEAGNTSPKANLAATVPRARTMSSDPNSWMRPSHYASTSANAAVKPVPKKLAQVPSDDTASNAITNAVHSNNLAQVVSDDSNTSSIATNTTKALPKRLAQLSSDDSNDDTTTIGTRVTPWRLTPVGAIASNASTNTICTNSAPKRLTQVNYDNSNVERHPTTKAVLKNLAHGVSTETLTDKPTAVNNSAQELAPLVGTSSPNAGDVAKSAKRSDVSLIASLKANLFKDDSSSKGNLVKASSLRLAPDCAKASDVSSQRGNDPIAIINTAPELSPLNVTSSSETGDAAAVVSTQSTDGSLVASLKANLFKDNAAPTANLVKTGSLRRVPDTSKASDMPNQMEGKDDRSAVSTTSPWLAPVNMTSSPDTGDANTTSTKPTEISSIASLKANLFKDDGSPKTKLVKASSIRLVPASEKEPDAPSQIEGKTVKSPSFSVKTINADKNKTGSRPPPGPTSPKLARRESADGTSPPGKAEPSNAKAAPTHVPRRATADSSSWVLSQNATVQGTRTDRASLGPLPPRPSHKTSSASTVTHPNELGPLHAEVDSLGPVPQNPSSQGNRTERPPLGLLSPRLAVRRASADCRPKPVQESEASLGLQSSSGHGSRGDKPPLGMLSPRLARRASTDCGQKLVQKSAPLSSETVITHSKPRRASVNSSSWLQAQNVAIQGKRIDPKKECALNSSISDLKSKFTAGTSTNDTRPGHSGSKVDLRQECMYNSSVRELKEVFNPTVIEVEPEEPEFDLLDSPVREARKSAKILDAISQLVKSGDRVIPKIDPLDEMSNSSKGSLESFAKPSKPDCKHHGEGSLTDFFGVEAKINADPSQTKEASGHDESRTEESSEVEEEEVTPVLPTKLSKEERRRRARMMWQSERSMNASFVQTSPNASFIQGSAHGSLTVVSSDV